MRLMTKRVKKGENTPFFRNLKLNVWDTDQTEDTEPYG